MLALIVLIIKLIIGGAISYILPFVSKKDISESNHLKIACIGILSTSMFSVSIQMDPTSPYTLSAGSMVLIGFLSHSLSNKMEDIEKILFYCSAVIGLFIGFGYILQGIILSFLVYYITNNQSDLFSIIKNRDENLDDNDNN